jgi:hypothetical protein
MPPGAQVERKIVETEAYSMPVRKQHNPGEYA